MINIYNSGVLKQIFFAIYLMMIILSVFVSIALPIDRAMPYFRVVAVVMSILVLLSIAGICYFMSQQTFFPEAYVPAEDPSDPPVPTGETYFSLLVLAGVIMLSVYMLPFIMRPIDFIKNAKKYIIGFISYMFLMPMFTNIFQIYAMCNLHDISWGNRPTSTGAEAFTANKSNQAKITGDYAVFRTNFVLMWLGVNIVYFIMISQFVQSQSADGSFGYLEIFSLVLAGLVTFRFLFGAIYIINWKCKYCCMGRYKVEEKNLEAEFKDIKKRSGHASNGLESTDDEEIEEQINQIFT